MGAQKEAKQFGKVKSKLASHLWEKVLVMLFLDLYSGCMLCLSCANSLHCTNIVCAVKMLKKKGLEEEEPANRDNSFIFFLNRPDKKNVG